MILTWKRTALLCAGITLAVPAFAQHGFWSERRVVVHRAAEKVQDGTRDLVRELRHEGHATHGEVRALKARTEALHEAVEKLGRIVGERPMDHDDHLKAHVLKTARAFRVVASDYKRFKDRFEETFHDLERHKFEHRFAERLERTFLEVVTGFERLSLHVPHTRFRD